MLGELLRRERIRRQERQVESAARFGVSQSSYHRWESGESTPSTELYGPIGLFLGLNLSEVHEIIHGTSEPTTLSSLQAQVDALARDIRDLRILRLEVDFLRSEVAEIRRAGTSHES